MRPRHRYPVFRWALLVVVLFTAVHGRTAAGDEWQVITEEESRLAIEARWLDNASGRFQRKEDGSATIEYAGWISRQGRLPRVELYSVILHHTFHWKTAPFEDLRSETQSWNFLKNRKLLVGRNGTYANGLGRGKFMTFTVGSIECFSFQQYWREPNETRGTSVGSRYLTGYYCGEEDIGVDGETMHAILDSIYAPH